MFPCWSTLTAIRVASKREDGNMLDVALGSRTVKTQIVRDITYSSNFLDGRDEDRRLHMPVCKLLEVDAKHLPRKTDAHS